MTAGASSPLDRFPRMIARVGGGLLLAFGLWAMAGPRSFFDSLATFDPYNQHLIQDLGALQIGLGVVLLVAALVSPSDGLLTGLVGVGAAMAAHAVSHAVGLDLGGTPKVDIPMFAMLGGLLLGGGLVRWRQLQA